MCGVALHGSRGEEVEGGEPALSQSSVGLLLQQVDRQVGLPLSAGEQRRAAALQKLVAVRNFAHQDCEPCCVIDGLFVGAALKEVYPCHDTATCQCQPIDGLFVGAAFKFTPAMSRRMPLAQGASGNKPALPALHSARMRQCADLLGVLQCCMWSPTGRVAAQAQSCCLPVAVTQQHDSDRHAAAAAHLSEQCQCGEQQEALRMSMEPTSAVRHLARLAGCAARPAGSALAQLLTCIVWRLVKLAERGAQPGGACQS